MNHLTKYFGLYYTYEIDIRSLTPQEVSMLKRHSDANYFKITKIKLTSVPPNETWRVRWGSHEQFIWNYDVLVYG